MGVIRVDVNSVAVGADGLGTDSGKRRSWPRVITGIALVGGSAIGDTGVDIFVETTKVATVYNDLVQPAPTKDNITPQRIPVPAQAEISAPVVDVAPAACFLYLYTQP